ncbi:MAG: hypothetical protein F6K19_01550 [Cyanothece sp. SIO1E1]|nr:hypothetical protein [Cyanothece sp. SIO1E1]
MKTISRVKLSYVSKGVIKAVILLSLLFAFGCKKSLNNPSNPNTSNIPNNSNNSNNSNNPNRPNGSTPIPVDIIIVIDNSSGMKPLIQGMQGNFNSILASRLEADSIDYRIILISKFGSANDGSVCIGTPLSKTNCFAQSPILVNSDKFFHYSEKLSSTNSLCKILETLNVADEYNLAPNGWIDWLRTNSTKVFLEFSNEGVNCSSGERFNDSSTAAGGKVVADAFNLALTRLSPSHFGTSTNPNYRFYSFIANPDKDANNPEMPYSTSDPITLIKCNRAVNPGTGYQGLSILTNGLRFSLCQPDDYDVIFDAMAKEVINVATK